MSAIDKFVQILSYPSEATYKRTKEKVGSSYDWDSPFYKLTDSIATMCEQNDSRYGHLIDHNAFGDGGRERWALFWAFEFATNSHLIEFIETHEETRTAAYFGAVVTALAVIGAISEKPLDFSCYFADCRSDKTEFHLGADFAFIMPLSDTLFKVALFQAKNVDGAGQANLYRQSPASSEVQQIERLIDVESEFVGDTAGDNTLWGHLSYYAFWHNFVPNSMPSPSVISARQAYSQVFGEVTKWKVDPLKDATSLSHALSLLLPEQYSGFGAELSLNQVIALLSNEKTRPLEIIGLAGPSYNFALSNWRALLGTYVPESEKIVATAEMEDVAKVYGR